MKFHADATTAHTITAHGSGWIRIGDERIGASVILGYTGERLAWNCTRFDALEAAHFARLATLDAEVILFGSGERLRFVPPAWLAPLMARRIGLETMDTAAACRTYNFLVAEGRRVFAALLLEG